MEKEPVKGFSQEELDIYEEGKIQFKAALTDEEVKLLTHIHLHGRLQADKMVDERVSSQEEAAKEKLRKAGLDADNYGKYIELMK